MSANCLARILHASLLITPYAVKVCKKSRSNNVIIRKDWHHKVSSNIFQPIGNYEEYRRTQ